MKTLKQFLNTNNEPNKVFLGGTCNESTWRDELIPKLEDINFDYFNPVVEDWTPECQAVEIYEKENKCNSSICHNKQNERSFLYSRSN